MKKYIIGAIAALCLCGISCNRSDDVPDGIATNEKTMFETESKLDELLSIAEAPQRSKEEALAIASRFAGVVTRARVTPSTQFELDYVLSGREPGTYSADDRTAPVDTMLYIMNGKNAGGFFIISGDRRLPELLASSESGHLDKGNVDDDSGFSVFLSRLPAYYEQAVAHFYEEMDSLEVAGDSSGSGEPLTYRIYGRRRYRPRYTYVYSDWRDVSRTANLVPVTWHQDSPYNNEAALIGNKRAAAGCVATAAAQLVSAFRYPLSYRGISLDWGLLTKKTEALSFNEYQKYSMQASFLFRKIGDRLGNSWGLAANGGTGAHTSDIPGVLRDMGYSHPSRLTSFNADGIISSIAQNCPVIVSGFQEEYITGWFIFSTTRHRIGHAWISDGYLRQERTVKKVYRLTKEVLNTKIESRVLLHCNWGWGGYSDGYFIPGVFDAKKPTVADSWTRAESVNGSSPCYFQYKVENILHIHP